MGLDRIPEQCVNCMNFTREDMLCSMYEQLPGEFGREDVEKCPSFLDRDKGEEELTSLIKYMDEDTTIAIEDSLTKVLDKVLRDYSDKFKIIVIGMARRKIKSMVKMVDITDSLIDKLHDNINLDEITPNQAIRLLSELNASVNNDLAFIMKLINPDNSLKDLQTYVDARSINISTGTSPTTDKIADEILALTPSSRDKVRSAFDSILNTLDGSTYEEVPDVTQVDKEGDYDG